MAQPFSATAPVPSRPLVRGDAAVRSTGSQNALQQPMPKNNVRQPAAHRSGFGVQPQQDLPAQEPPARGFLSPQANLAPIKTGDNSPLYISRKNRPSCNINLKKSTKKQPRPGCFSDNKQNGMRPTEPDQYSLPLSRLRRITSYPKIYIISETSSKRIVFLASLFVTFWAVVGFSGCLSLIRSTICFKVVCSTASTVLILQKNREETL